MHGFHKKRLLLPAVSLKIEVCKCRLFDKHCFSIYFNLIDI